MASPNKNKRLTRSLECYNIESLRKLPNPLLVNKGKPKKSLSIITMAHIDCTPKSNRTQKDSGMKLLVITKDIIDRQSLFISTIVSETKQFKANTTMSNKNLSLNDSSVIQNRSLPITFVNQESNSNNNQSTTLNQSKGKEITQNSNHEENYDLETELYIPKLEVTDKFDYLHNYFDAPSFKAEYSKLCFNIPDNEKVFVINKNSHRFARDLAMYEKGVLLTRY